MFKTISENTTAEIVEKKSRFIANIFYVESVQEAERIIKETKKKYFDARHNCFAFSIFSQDGIINRFSDDGEPSGTAGAPILNILTSKKLNNVLVIVTRYFGGILLGTGGLVRAYTGATIEALKNIKEIEKELGIEAKIEISYSDFEKTKYYLNQNQIKILRAEYNENVAIYVETSENKFQNMILNKIDLNFNIIKEKIIKNKYVEI